MPEEENIKEIFHRMCKLLLQDQLDNQKDKKDI
jgi:hypothetical protein